MRYTFFACFIILSGLLSAQNLTQTIRGKVVDQNTQEPLIGVLIEAYADSVKSGAITNSEGEFRLESMPVGRYTLNFSYLGYENAGVSRGSTRNYNLLRIMHI